MRLIRDIRHLENARVVAIPELPNAITIKVDPIEPEPVGTVVLLPFRIAGFDRDCDGSLMVRMENLMRWHHSEDGLAETGWDVDSIGLDPDTGFVVSEDELVGLFDTLAVQGGDVAHDAD